MFSLEKVVCIASTDGGTLGKHSMNLNAKVTNCIKGGIKRGKAGINPAVEGVEWQTWLVSLFRRTSHEQLKQGNRIWHLAPNRSA